MFGIEPITMWYRLVAVVPDGYKLQIENAEATTQLFLNLASVSIAYAIGAVYLAFDSQRASTAAMAIPLLALAYALYSMACRNAFDWGEQIRAAFDLYRFTLLRQLALHVPEPQPWSLETERAIWTRLQRVTYYSNVAADTTFAPTATRPGGASTPSDD
jgi:hypothetical protein